MTTDGAPEAAGHLEGTFVVEGLVEGRLGRPETAERVRAWAAEQAASALHFALEVDGATFSLLPSPEPVRAAALRPDPGVRLEEALRALVATLPTDVRGETYSTLHSVEVRPGQLVRNVYAVTPAGDVRREERIVAATTRPPAGPPSTRTLVMGALAGLGALAVLFAISSIFVDWGATLRGFWHQVSPLSPDDVKVDAAAFDGHFKVTKHAVGAESRSVVLTLARGPKFPASLDAAPPAPATWREGLAADAVALGRVHAEVYDAQGAWIGSAEVRIAGLREKETVEVSVPVTREPRPARVVLVP
ncbi:MAG: hypothetical protein U1E39_12740 [Planctomycetota bacterium]